MVSARHPRSPLHDLIHQVKVYFRTALLRDPAELRQSLYIIHELLFQEDKVS